MKAYWDVYVNLHVLYSKYSVLDGSKRSYSHPEHFIPGKRSPCSHWIGDKVDARDGLDAVVNKRQFCVTDGTRLTVVKSIANHVTDWLEYVVAYLKVLLQDLLGRNERGHEERRSSRISDFPVEIHARKFSSMNTGHRGYLTVTSVSYFEIHIFKSLPGTPLS